MINDIDFVSNAIYTDNIYICVCSSSHNIFVYFQARNEKDLIGRIFHSYMRPLEQKLYPPKKSPATKFPAIKSPNVT